MDDFALRVLYEDNHLIAINKLASDIVQSDETGDEPLIDKVKQYIKVRDNKPGNVFVEVIHRIDRPVSGVVLMAKTSKGLSRMNELFRDGKVKKLYWAIVGNMPPKETDTLKHHILRNPHKNRSYAYNEHKPGTKEASLTYRLVGKSERYYFLEVDLHTGRHHQIRAQLAVIGLPIKGDLKYGAPRSNPGGGISLHSRMLEFIHPVTDEAIRIVAPTPNDTLWQEFAKL